MDKIIERPEYGTLHFFEQHLDHLLKHQHELDEEFVREERDVLTSIIEKIKSKK